MAIKKKKNRVSSPDTLEVSVPCNMSPGEVVNWLCYQCPASSVEKSCLARIISHVKTLDSIPATGLVLRYRMGDDSVTSSTWGNASKYIYHFRVGE